MIDYTKNQNPTSIYKVLEVLDENTPEYIKGAEIPSESYVAGLNKQAFADQKNRLFPCYDQLTTWLSACDVYGNNIQNEEVLDTLEKRASFLGVKDDIDKIKEVFSPKIVKSASEEENFALVIEENDRSVGYWPVSDIIELDETCSEWKAARAMGTVPSDLLKIAAEVIVRAAERMDAIDSVPVIIKEASVEKMAEFEGIEQKMQFRINSVQNDEAKDLYIKMASSLTAETAGEWIDIMDVMDHSLLTPELRKHDMYVDPHSLVYSGPAIEDFKKLANSIIPVEIEGNQILVPNSDFEKLEISKVEKTFPTSCVNILKQAKESNSTTERSNLLNSLPEDYKVEVLEHLSSYA
jgi:hypothetical protein